jgi:lysyl-tRNA synthetase class 2
MDLLLSKTLRPLPLPKVDEDGKVHDAFNDAELRYRMRYVDLTVNEQKETFIKRTKCSMRCVLSLMTEDILRLKPCFTTYSGGAAARPFITHHNSLTCHYTCVLPMSCI